MTRLGTCAGCGGDIMLVTFDDANGCRFCMGCGTRGPTAVILETEIQLQDDDITLVDVDHDDPTMVGAPDATLLDIAKGHRP